MNLTDINYITKLLKKHGFSFSKALGQNFIVDETICPRIAEIFNLEQCGVIEIGTGIGVLTKELAKRAKKVVAIELDKRLFPILNETLAEYNNIKIIHGDILKTDINAIISEEFKDMDVYVCGNLPYYITSPIIMNFLENKIAIKGLAVMVQKEAAERLTALPGCRDCGAVSATVNYYCTPSISFEVNRYCFVPSPNVDSAVIKLEIRNEPIVNPKSTDHFFKIVHGAFAQRRKTLVNSLSSSLKIEKDELINALSKLGIDNSIRAEKMTIQQFSDLSDILL